MRNIDDGNNNAINEESCSTSGCGRENSGCNNTTNDSTLDKIERQAAILFNAKKYSAANVIYTKLIEMFPNNSKFYGRRAASYMMLGDDFRGLEDANKSVELDPAFIEGHCNVIKSAMRLHKFSQMDSSVAKLKVLDPTNEILQYQSDKMRELIQNLENEVLATTANDYTKVLEYIDKSLGICPQFLDYKVKKAECLINLERSSEAEAIANEILKQNPNNSDGHYILGRCWRQKNIEKSVHHFEEAFRLNPRCIKDRTSYESAKKFLEKKNQADDAYKSQKFADAHSQYSALALECHNDTMMTMTLYFNMAEASHNLGRFDRCLQECTSVLNLKPDHLRALIRRASCHMTQKQYGKAIEDFEKAWSVKSSAEVLKILQEVYKRLVDSHNGSYVILGLVQGASREVVTKAFKDLTKLHHPDRHANSTDEQKKYHEMKCKEITRAYRLLMDQKPASGTSSNDTNESQKPDSPPKQPPGFKTDSSHNDGQQSSSGGTNNNSPGSQSTAGGANYNSSGPQSSSGSSNHYNGQQSSFGGTNNNSNGPQSSSGGSDNYNRQQSSSRGTNYSFTGPQSSSGGANYHSSGPQSSSGSSNHYNGQQSSFGGTNNSSNGPQSSSGGPNNYNGQQSSSGRTSYNYTGSAAGGSYNYNEQESSSGNANNNSTGYQSSAGASNTQKPQSSSGTSEHNSSGNYRNRRERSRPRRSKDRSRPYWNRRYTRYCHYCDWYIYGGKKSCPHCGFYPKAVETISIYF